MLFTAASDGKIIEVNEAGARMFRYTGVKEMCAASSIASLFLHAGWRSLWERLEAEGFVKDMEMQMQRMDGSCFPATISAVIGTERDGTLLCYTLLRDMTRQCELHEANRDLEQRIGDLRQRVSQTLMILSHDLRGPLTTMAAGLKLLVRGAFGSMDDGVADRLQGLLAQTVRLAGIAEDCLGRAAIVDGIGEIRKESLDLREDIIDPILEEFTEDFLAERITVENRGKPIRKGVVTIHASGRWLRSVYRNLFRNAVQYGGRGCIVSFGYEEQGHFYRLHVYNSGEPVPKESRDMIFTKFGRIGGTAEKVDGTGLGLYLVREIIRKHGGDIRYEAAEGGSKFVFTIPKDREG